MDVRGWCTSGTRTMRLGRNYHELETANLPSAACSSRPLWKMMWRKFLKEKRKMLESSSVHVHGQVPYDEYTYSQNFDEGPASAEPENLSRSFSVRFSDQSRFRLDKNDKM